MRSLIWAGVFVGCLLTAGTAVSQEIVHALTGTVVKVDGKAGKFTIKPDDGSDGVFKLAPSMPESALSFNKDVKAESVPAATYAKTGVQVLVYFIGYDDDRTAVAVQELGSAPLDKVVGSVVKYSKHEMTILNASGKEQTFAIDPKTVAEMNSGVMPGEKAGPHKGLQVKVVAARGSGTETALFVRSMGV